MNPRIGPLMDPDGFCPKTRIPKQRMTRTLHTQFDKTRISYTSRKIDYLGPVTEDPPKVIVGVVTDVGVGSEGLGGCAEPLPPPLRLARTTPAAPATAMMTMSFPLDFFGPRFV